jgi:hypothetical protein
VEFFGIRSKARSVGFVVDCSGSMAGTRMTHTKAELVESIIRLKPEQRFYVTFFSSGEQPMSAAPRSLAPASFDEKIRCYQWIRPIDAEGGTNPESSVLLTAQMKPDAIYLLSDGEFSALNPATFEQLAADRIVVNTVAFEDESGANMLREIAERTGGSYRFVPPGTPPKDPELTMVAWLARNLETPPPADVQPFRDALRTLSDGQDFGPPAEATVDQRRKASDDWFTWWASQRLLPVFATFDRSRLLAELGSPSPLARWAALRTARQGRFPIFEECVAALRDDSRLVSQAARAALIELSGGEDYGPPPDASEVDRARAIAQWNGWRDKQLAAQREAEAAEQRRREMEAAEQRRKQREAAANEELRLTAILRDQFERNKRWADPEFRDRVKERLQRIVNEFPETAGAKKAQQLLQQIE